MFKFFGCFKSRALGTFNELLHLLRSVTQILHLLSELLDLDLGIFGLFGVLGADL